MSFHKIACLLLKIVLLPEGLKLALAFFCVLGYVKK